MGYVEGRNVDIEYRWAEFQNNRLAQLAAELVGHPVKVIATIGGSPPAFAARSVTNKVPIVFYSGVDPIKSGLIESFNRPGGNATGIAALQAQLIEKRIELLNETVPNIKVVTLLANPTNPYTETETQILFSGARSLNLQLRVVKASRIAEFESAFFEAKNFGTQAIVSADLFLHGQREKLVALAASHALPAIYPWREYVTVGGLMSYGPNLLDASRLIGVYSGKILRGSDPATLPVEQHDRVHFAINLKTARSFRVTFSLPLLGRADEVIE